jgi:Mor family transcriptional regulator
MKYDIDAIKTVYAKSKPKLCTCPLCLNVLKKRSLHYHVNKHNISFDEFNSFCIEVFSESNEGKQIIKDYQKEFCFLPISEICETYNLQHQFVKNLFLSKKIIIRNHSTPIKELAQSLIGSQIKQFYLNGMSLRDLSKKFSLQRTFITEILRLQKIKKTHTHPKNTICLFCRKNTSNLGIYRHVQDVHNIKAEQYKEKIIENFISKEEIIKEFLYDYEHKQSLKFLSKKFNLVKDVVKMILKKFNIRIRSMSENTTKRHIWFLYENEYYQSSWEIQFAMWLKNKNIAFISHSKILPLEFYDKKSKSYRKYFPDFYVDSWKTFVEIKGRLDEETIQKHKDICESNPKEHIIILSKEYFEKNEIFKIEKLVNKDIYDYVIFPNNKENQLKFLLDNKKEILTLYKGKDKKNMTKLLLEDLMLDIKFFIDFNTY